MGTFLEDWDWLLKNHPWKYEGSDERADVMLGMVKRDDGEPICPAVIVMDTYWDGGSPSPEDVTPGYNWCTTGTDWHDAVKRAIRRAEEDMKT